MVHVNIFFDIHTFSRNVLRSMIYILCLIQYNFHYFEKWEKYIIFKVLVRAIIYYQSESQKSRRKRSTEKKKDVANERDAMRNE